MHQAPTRDAAGPTRLSSTRGDAAGRTRVSLGVGSWASRRSPASMRPQRIRQLAAVPAPAPCASQLDRAEIELNGTSMTHPERSNRLNIKPALYDYLSVKWTYRRLDRQYARRPKNQRSPSNPLNLIHTYFAFAQGRRDRRADVSHLLAADFRNSNPHRLFFQKNDSALWISSESQFILLEIRRIPKARSQ